MTVCVPNHIVKESQPTPSLIRQCSTFSPKSLELLHRSSLAAPTHSCQSPGFSSYNAWNRHIVPHPPVEARSHELSFYVLTWSDGSSNLSESPRLWLDKHLLPRSQLPLEALVHAPTMRLYIDDLLRLQRRSQSLILWQERLPSLCYRTQKTSASRVAWRHKLFLAQRPSLLVQFITKRIYVAVPYSPPLDLSNASVGIAHAIALSIQPGDLRGCHHLGTLPAEERLQVLDEIRQWQAGLDVGEDRRAEPLSRRRSQLAPPLILVTGGEIVDLRVHEVKINR